MASIASSFDDTIDYVFEQSRGVSSDTQKEELFALVEVTLREIFQQRALAGGISAAGFEKMLKKGARQYHESLAMKITEAIFKRCASGTPLSEVEKSQLIAQECLKWLNTEALGMGQHADALSGLQGVSADKRAKRAAVLRRKIQTGKMTIKLSLEKNRKLFHQLREETVAYHALLAKGTVDITIELIHAYIEETKEQAQKSATTEADQHMAELLALEEVKAPKSKGKKAPKQPKRAPQQKQKKPQAGAASAAAVDAPVSTQSVSLREIYLSSLHTRKTDFLITSRVSRWAESIPAKVRAFQDKKDGAMLKRYEELDDEDIAIQRARHYLPGVEKLLADPKDCAKYAFKTSRGYGLFCELHVNKTQEYGVLYFGIDGKKIFHRYFEPIRDEQKIQDIFKQGCEENSEVEGFTPVGAFSVDITATDVVVFTYEGHTLQVHPLTIHG